MFNESELALNNRSQVIITLVNASQVLFGKNVENIPKILFDSSYQAIIDRFINITVDDIKNSYRDSIIEKKEYVSLTRDELIEPIKNYWNKKLKVQIEIDKCIRLSEEEKENEQKQIDFFNNSKEKYKESLMKGFNILDEYECNVIAIKFKDNFKQEVKNLIWIDAQKEYQERVKKEVSQFSIVPPARMIFSRMIIEKCISKKYKFIED